MRDSNVWGDPMKGYAKEDKYVERDYQLVQAVSVIT